MCAHARKREERHGEGRTEHSTESLIAFPFPITMLISLPYFGPLVVNKPAQKNLCRCCSWSCAILPQMAERGAGRRRRPEIVHALRISPPNYRPGLPFIAEPPPPSGIRRCRGVHLRLAVHPGWCDLRPGFAADANLKGEMRQHYAMISGWTRSLSSR